MYIHFANNYLEIGYLAGSGILLIGVGFLLLGVSAIIRAAKEGK